MLEKPKCVSRGECHCLDDILQYEGPRARQVADWMHLLGLVLAACGWGLPHKAHGEVGKQEWGRGREQP